MQAPSVGPVGVVFAGSDRAIAEVVRDALQEVAVEARPVEGPEALAAYAHEPLPATIFLLSPDLLRSPPAVEDPAAAARLVEIAARGGFGLVVRPCEWRRVPWASKLTVLHEDALSAMRPGSQADAVRRLAAAVAGVPSPGPRSAASQEAPRASQREPATESGDRAQSLRRPSAKAAPRAPPPVRVRATVTKPRATDPGVVSDLQFDRDLLGIEKEVESFASLVASTKLEPPLSIGVFGDWGSGKTFFLRSLQREVAGLARRASGSSRPQSEVAWVKDVVQIEFNAWHYVEGNLWASLVEHIFSNLRPQPDDADDARAKKREEELLGRLRVRKEIEEKAKAKLARLAAQRDEAARLATMARTQEATAAAARAAAGARALDVPAPVLAPADLARLDRLRFPPELVRTAEDLVRLEKEARTLAGRVRIQARLLAKEPARVLPLVGTAGLVVGVPTLAFVGAAAANLSGAWQGAGFVAAALATWIPKGFAYAGRVSQALDVLETKAREHDAAVVKARRERDALIAKLEAERDLLAQQRLDAERDLRAASEQVKAAEAALQVPSAELLARFVDARASADDYRKHLGVPALVRRDFEELTSLFLDQRREEAASGAGGNVTPIDRIVLYIDDLDRCPPDRVVDVLQAIHLLLAFKLFVVVVAVDARWVTRALREEYPWLAPENGAGEGATPHDYLEKIFNVPFWVRPMDEPAAKRLIEGLARATIVQGAAAPPPLASAGPAAAAAPAPGAAPGLAQPAPPPGASGVAAPRADDSLSPQTLELTDAEVAFMSSLVPVLGRSPRAVKRFVNCYRILRAQVRDEAWTDFLGTGNELAGYQAMMILLGAVTGAPDTADDFLGRLEEADGEMPFEEFLAGIESEEPFQHPEWAPVAAWLARFADQAGVDVRVGSFAAVAPGVARFSFRRNAYLERGREEAPATTPA